MKKLLPLLLITLLTGFVSYAQSGRGTPVSGGKQNQRPVRPRVTPTPVMPEKQPEEPAPEGVEDSGELVTVDTQLVTIPVRVIDRKNRFIGGLAQQNFKVFEDNIEQEIAYFTNEAQPFTVALVLDMSYSTTFKLAEIQSAAIAFIAQLRPEDKVMVISFDEEIHMLCEATNDRDKIYRAIKSTAITTGTSLYEAVNLTINDRLRKIEGRKAMVLFTDGVDTTSRLSNDRDNLRDALEIDTLIYPIRYDTFADVQRMKNDPTARPGSIPTTTPPTVPTNKPGDMIPILTSIGTGGDKGTTPEEYAKAEEYLNQLALNTGGRIYFADTVENLTLAFARIASELREFYSLGYYPKADAKPGKVRRIKVKVDQEKMVVKARDSYVVPKSRK